MRRYPHALLLFACAALLSACHEPAAPPAVNTAPLGAGTLAVIVNDADPASVAAAALYVSARRIPERHVIHISFPPGTDVMEPALFRTLKAGVDAATPARVQGYLLTWTRPWRVGCMSITTAFAAGYDTAFCASGCKPTLESPYFDTDSSRPWNDFGWRPAMLLAGTDRQAVQALIERGVAADASRPPGSAYLLSTDDSARNVRARFYRLAQLLQSPRFTTRIVQADSLHDRHDVMFYFTGMIQVRDLDTLSFRPGAIADHLTSAGGHLIGGGQMSSLRWLAAGATASYGTVTEPCNFTEKFPRPDIVMERYLNGESLLEAYWKSVRMPGQGLFIGEPLARPFAH